MIIAEDLYRQICQLMPIACVDLLVTDELGRVLLIKRKNHPANDQWWFPGGRVHLNETRRAAAARKLQEECGLKAMNISEVGTFDVIFPEAPQGASHGITTLFHMDVKNGQVHLDDQSATSDWRLPHEWIEAGLERFVADRIRALSAEMGE
jgi:ADP-ribose pyrophosphatase YjhB (NUDIX family)